MCGRFVTIIPYEELKQIFDLIESDTRIEPRYNVAPTQHVAVVRNNGEHNVLTPMSWGLIPSWSKDASIPSSMFTRLSCSILLSVSRQPTQHLLSFLPKHGRQTETKRMPMPMLNIVKL